MGIPTHKAASEGNAHSVARGAKDSCFRQGLIQQLKGHQQRAGFPCPLGCLQGPFRGRAEVGRPGFTPVAGSLGPVMGPPGCKGLGRGQFSLSCAAALRTGQTSLLPAAWGLKEGEGLSFETTMSWEAWVLQPNLWEVRARVAGGRWTPSPAVTCCWCPQATQPQWASVSPQQSTPLSVCKMKGTGQPLGTSKGPG